MLSKSTVSACIPVSDVQRARKFYESTLGLKVKQETPGGTMFECGNASTLFVYPSGGAGTNKATTATWNVSDIHAAVADLKSKGVSFEEYDMPGLKTEDGIATTGNAKAAWFKDTEGNILGIVQM